MTSESERVWRGIKGTASSLRNHNGKPNLSTTSALEKDANSVRVGYVEASILTIAILAILKLLPSCDSVPRSSSITAPVFLFVVALSCLIVALPLAHFFEEQMKCYTAFRCYRYVQYSPVQHRFINIGVWRRVDSTTG